MSHGEAQRSTNVFGQPRNAELESECALMLSENLELRGRILELEKQVEDNEARRIADHALAIKAKLESQLTEWATLLSGLGLEPPMKRHSPRIRKSIKQRMSFIAGRPSPSQRRLRDVARDIEELGHISENRSSSRRSLNPEQIRALRCEAESAELEAPAEEQYIEQEPVKVDSPPRSTLAAKDVSSPRKPIEPPILLPSPRARKSTPVSASSPEKKRTEPGHRRQNAVPQPGTPAPEHIAASVKTGSKRKFAQDEIESTAPRQLTNENTVPRGMADKVSIREKAGGRTLKELAHMRKEAREKNVAAGNGRRPLASKSTNDDVGTPRKNPKPTAVDEVATAKAVLAKPKPVKQTTKSKAKMDAAARPASVPAAKIVLAAAKPVMADLATTVSEPVLLSPNSPEPAPDGDAARGDTPPPADISLNGETSRASRRNRTTISYAEPNLRDKMRRPTKELFDAVAGEGKYARRASHCESSTAEGAKIKRESDVIPAAGEVAAPEPGSIPASPLAKKSLAQGASMAVITERRRPASRAPDFAADLDPEADENESGEVDVYEFTSSSPQIDSNAPVETTRATRHRGTNTRRRSAAVDSEENSSARERSASRRRSMMV
ncbi:shugoshin [Metarhizium album ARSEF 1941]|uniref:Shugoshin n=1 Tax=Metarhizium album (strain ARSEF 1941) TaxID=1081103 RepID=A0A0B2WZR1_METAS|nr:shugoshin [Metarhizium album ARSEF 1941]KHN98315.1 shugoshin [Metarhizium album ARSEF 1941]